MKVDEYLLAEQDFFEKVNAVVNLICLGHYNGVHVTQILLIDWSS